MSTRPGRSKCNLPSLVNGVDHNCVTQSEHHCAFKLSLIFNDIHHGLCSPSKSTHFLRNRLRLQVIQRQKSEMSAPSLPHLFQTLLCNLFVLNHHRLVIDTQSDSDCHFVFTLPNIHEIA